MEHRNALNSKIEDSIATAGKRRQTKLEAEKVCPKCACRWWRTSEAVLRDLTRGGAVSKFNQTKFEFFECIACGHMELPTNTVNVSRELRNEFSDFVKAIRERQSNNTKITSTETPAEVKATLESIDKDIEDKKASRKK